MRMENQTMRTLTTTVRIVYSLYCTQMTTKKSKKRGLPCVLSQQLQQNELPALSLA